MMFTVALATTGALYRSGKCPYMLSITRSASTGRFQLIARADINWSLKLRFLWARSRLRTMEVCTMPVFELYSTRDSDTEVRAIFAPP